MARYLQEGRFLVPPSWSCRYLEVHSWWLGFIPTRKSRSDVKGPAIEAHFARMWSLFVCWSGNIPGCLGNVAQHSETPQPVFHPSNPFCSHYLNTFELTLSAAFLQIFLIFTSFIPSIKPKHYNNTLSLQYQATSPRYGRNMTTIIHEQFDTQLIGSSTTLDIWLRWFLHHIQGSQTGTEQLWL